MNRAQCIVIFILYFCADALADSFPPPSTLGVSSPKGNWVLRVEPAENWWEKPAKAHVFSFDGVSYVKLAVFTMNNRISPSTILITNEGTIFAFDRWDGRGHGDVIYVYQNDGTALKKYTLNDLYSESDILKFRKTVSSIWWRDLSSRPWTYEGIVCVKDSLGGSLEFDTQTAEFKHSVKDGCELTL